MVDLEDKIESEKIPTSEESLQSIARSLSSIKTGVYLMSIMSYFVGLSYCTSQSTRDVHVTNMPSQLYIPSNK